MRSLVVREQIPACSIATTEHAINVNMKQNIKTSMGNLRLCGPIAGRRGMKIEIVLTTTEAGSVVEKVVARDKVTDRTDIKAFLTWYAARLFKGCFNLHRDDDNFFGWVAIDSRGDTLTVVVCRDLPLAYGRRFRSQKW